MSKLKAISLYSGGGGIDCGAEQSGNIETILAIDIGKPECNTLKENFPDCEVIRGEVACQLSTLPKADVVFGGPPCPNFSRDNKDRNFDMCEVNNFWKAVEIVKPKYYLMENVQDVNLKLIKHNFKVNCADYGAPTTRVRRFYTNLKLPQATHAEYPQDTLFGGKLKRWISIREALGYPKDKKMHVEDRKSTFGEYYKKEDGEFRKYSVDKPSFTLVADARIWVVDDPKFQNITYDTRAYFNEIDKPARTLTTKDIGPYPSMMVSDGKYARKLTNEECAILQGFPDTYKFIGNKGDVKRMIGNSVPPMVIYNFMSTNNLDASKSRDY